MTVFTTTGQARPRTLLKCNLWAYWFRIDCCEVKKKQPNEGKQMQAPPKTKTEGFHELTVQDAGNPRPHLQMVSIAALPISGEQMVDSLGLLLRWVSGSLVSHVPSWSHEDGPSSPHPWGPARDLHYPWVGETDKRKFCYGPNCRMNKFNVFLGQTSHCFHQKLWIVSQIFELGKVYLQICMDIPQPFSDVWVRNRHARGWLSTQASEEQQAEFSNDDERWILILPIHFIQMSRHSQNPT